MRVGYVRGFHNRVAYAFEYYCCFPTCTADRQDSSKT